MSNTMSFDLSTLNLAPGTYKIKVQAKAKNWDSSGYSNEITYKVPLKFTIDGVSYETDAGTKFDKWCQSNPSFKIASDNTVQDLSGRFVCLMGTPAKSNWIIEVANYELIAYTVTFNLTYDDGDLRNLATETFTVDTYDYATFGDWIDRYDPANFEVDGGDYVLYNGCQLYNITKQNWVSSYDAIEADDYATHTYFYVDCDGDYETFVTKIGSTWKTWVGSSYDRLDWFSIDNYGYIRCNNDMLMHNQARVEETNDIMIGEYYYMKYVETDTFGIESGYYGAHFTYEIGMTWEEFVPTNYNRASGPCYISIENGEVMYTNPYGTWKLFDPQDVPITPTEDIQSLYYYSEDYY